MRRLSRFSPTPWERSGILFFFMHLRNKILKNLILMIVQWCEESFFFYVIEKLGNQLHKITFCFLYVGPRSTWKQCLQPCIACWPPRNNQFTSEHQLHIFLQSDSCQTLHYCHLFALIWTTGTPTSEPAECLHLLFYIKGGSKKELVKMNFFC